MLGIKFEIALDMGIATTTPYAVVENDIFGFWFHYIYFIIIYIGVYAMYMCVSWLRCDPLWKGRAIKDNGRMINNEEAITLTCNVLKKHLSLPLDEFEQGKENAFLDRK